MRAKLAAAVLGTALTSSALAQTGATAPQYVPPQPGASAQPVQPAQPAQQPAQPGVAAQPAQPPPAAPQPGTAGSSQQVVVNPPAAAALPPAPAPSAPSVQVNPPPAPPPAPQPTVVIDGNRRAETVIVDERRERRSPMSTVATNALYGGLAGAVVGAGIALINEGDDWGRDLMLGTGIGVLAGAVVGGVMAYNDRGDRVAMDGLGTPARDRDRQRRMTPIASYALRW